MSSSYKTDYQRVTCHVKVRLWSVDEMNSVQEAIRSKGYKVTVIPRNSNDGELKNSLDVKRDEVGVFSELLFKKRLDLEMHPAESFRVSILLLDNIPAEVLIDTIKRFLPKR